MSTEGGAEGDEPAEPKSPSRHSAAGSKLSNGCPQVVISEPGSPEFVGKTLDDMENDNNSYIGDDYSLYDGSQLGVNQDFDMSTFSLNIQGDTVALVPAPPDGGYGWVIVLGAFMSNLIVDGIATCFTEFKGAYSEHFHTSDALTALIGSLLIGVYLLVGPIVGGLVNSYGERKIVIAGAVISGVAFLVSVASPNIYVFMLLYGGLGGAGFGMIYLPAIVAVGYYFESKRAIATGIAVAGSGVGTIILPFLCEILVKELGWKYSVWILAVLVFTCAGFGLLYKPLPLVPVEQEKKSSRAQELEPLRQALSKLSEEDETEEQDDRAQSQMSSNAVSEQNPSTRPESVVADNSDDPAMARLRNALSECEENTEDKEAPSRPPLSPLPENQPAARTSTRTQGSTESGGKTSIAAPPVQTIGRPRKLTLTSMTSDMMSTGDVRASRSNLNTQLSRVSARSFAQSLSRLSNRGDTSTLSIALAGVDPQEIAKPMNRTDIFYGGSIRNLREFKQEGGNIASYRGSVLSIPRSVVGQAVSNLNLNAEQSQSRAGVSKFSRDDVVLPEVEEFVDDSKFKFIPLAIRSALSQMIDFNLLMDPVMIILFLSNLLGMMGFYIPFVYFKDLAHQSGIPSSHSKFLVPIIGVTNTIGRVFFGWLADRHYVSALSINNFSLIACGVLTLACPLFPSFGAMVGYASLFGFFISAYVCLTSIVLADLLGLELLTNSFGLLVVARGIASLAGTPVAGLVHGVTKSYNACFYFAGFVIVISGLISCLVTPLDKCKRSRRGYNEGDFGKPSDGGLLDQIGDRLSVLTEENEDNMTDYQRTIQSLRQQHALLKEMEDEKKKMDKNKKNGAKSAVTEENEEDEEVPLKILSNGIATGSEEKENIKSD